MNDSASLTRFLHHAAFGAGLAAVCWVGAGYVGSNALALAITLLVAAFYLLGAFELQRFHQATASLRTAVAALHAAPASLAAWLDRLHPSLRNAVRLRVEGERIGLPGPALTPYLAGLLVLLGMLGTFVGMVVTLNGTGLALDSALDVQSMRASLSAPVRGLGLAFGTSVAGVAASAMLGLMSALRRRERLQAAQLLDTRIAGPLRVFSQAHQRDESFKLLQQQTQGMPQLIDQLQTMMATLQQQQQNLHERLAAGNQALHERLATGQQTLHEGLLAGQQTLQDSLSKDHQALHTSLVAGQDGFHHKAELVYTQLATAVQHTLEHSLLDTARAAGAALQPLINTTLAGITRETAALHGAVLHTVQQQLDGLATRFDSSTARTAALWSDALVQHQQVSERVAQHTQQALTAAAGSFDQQAAALLRSVDGAHGELQTRLAARDEQRLAAWTGALQAMAAALQQQWQQAGADNSRQQQRVCDTLAQTAAGIAAQSQAQARQTLAELAGLVQAAAEAPRAAAQVIGELRQHLSDSIGRDNGMLEERSRMLATVAAQLDAVNHASNDQRAAIDALVATSADLLQRAGQRFGQQVDAEAVRLAGVAAQLGGSAAEVASLGEAFGSAVQLFGQHNDKLLAQLQRVETALGKTLVRSDEQLAYYVAQAREVIDLSIMSQKQIVEDLQQLADRREHAGHDSVGSAA